MEPTANITLPRRPVQVLNPAFDLSNQLSSIEADVNGTDDIKDSSYKQIRSVFTNNSTLLLNLRYGMGSDEGNGKLIASNVEIIRKVIDAAGAFGARKDFRVSVAIEQAAHAQLLDGFFRSGGRLLPAAAVPYCNDEEYLGACIAVAQDLARYAVDRAIVNDIESIGMCRALLEELNGKMLEFDFRNGPLRRKYDGLKYALRSVEDIVFELSLTDKDRDTTSTTAATTAATVSTTVEDVSLEPAEKRARIETVQRTDLLDAADFDAIRKRLDEVDAKREDLIKKSRDVQKLSKQAIFSIQRGNLNDASDKLRSAKGIASNLFDNIVSAHPTLRFGAFSACLEEWAEGALLLEWVRSKRIMGQQELGLVDSTEYIGALSDFTGEIGRCGVAAASKRDVNEVYSILQTMISVSIALTQLDCGGRFLKKTEAVQMNLKKMQDVHYELVLLSRGGKPGKISKDAAPMDSGNNNDNDA